MTYETKKNPRQATPPKALYLDVETRSRIDLKEVGAWRYAADPSTEALVLAFAADAGPAELWFPGMPAPAEIVAAAADPECTVGAHNAAFERVIWKHILGPRHGFPEIPLERWRCSMALAHAAALPGGLEKACEALGLPVAKDKAGAALMLRMCKPRRNGTWLEDAAPATSSFRTSI
jgi:DNA polymerase